MELQRLRGSDDEDGNEIRSYRVSPWVAAKSASVLLAAASVACLAWTVHLRRKAVLPSGGAAGPAILGEFSIPFSLPFISNELTVTTTPLPTIASMFCFCVMRTGGYEQDILEVQRRHDAGIFDCDDQMVLADEALDLGGGSRTTAIGHVNSTLGQAEDATRSWVNTEIFLRAWWNVRADGRFASFDWTVKVDPDTVLLPELLRHHLARRGFDSYLGETSAIFIRNCPVARSGFYGAVEVMSRGAIEDLLSNLDSCRDKLRFKGWGEDLFAQMCMEQNGVNAYDDFDLVADGACRGPTPPKCSPGHPAYHPLKSVDLWMRCWNRARTGTPAEIEMRDQQNFGKRPEHLHKFPDLAKLAEKQKELEHFERIEEAEEKAPTVFKPIMFTAAPLNAEGEPPRVQ